MSKYRPTLEEINATAALGIAGIEWHDAGIEKEQFITNLYK
jgi:hypothetical protein